MWGFSSSVFKQIRERFTSFLDNNINNPGAEYYIPTLVDQLINAEQAKVKVLQCNASWFGITYKEDKAAARESILKKIEKGEYPERLWK
jgi:hypothetical protein